ncbi:helix-turn-helix transcriptional regulator [Streptomyces violaceus]|uniref:LuxR C-terminal-related transcriptional regulator n=1 Tax=Streptomyces violaceus TaxID=1936 RepID=A0ABY9UQI6_STRVL|nr:LuxR C-terminal-related transcriptional regulator [Streptomyces janthinus]WND24060.1 LuxR C-terminal-related transcriptional regulator [Streptomyces janthinus]
MLSANAVTAYGLISSGREVPDELQPAVEELVRWGFVVLDTDRENRPVALNPHQVAQRRLEEMLRENADRIARMRALPAMADEMAAAYERTQGQAGSEYLDDAAVVNARLDDLISGAEFEILAAQPNGPRTRGQLNRSVTRDTAALDRGVTLRTLYQATVRDTPVTAEHARAMSTRPVGKRAQYATLVGPFERCIVVDRRVAFVSNHLVEGAPAHSAWQITDRAMVAFIVAEFQDKWRRADPWHGELRGREHTVDTITGAGGERTTRRQREIMRDLAEGLDQRAIATRLGVSVRTVADEITALKDAFDAKSQAQLGYRWASSVDRLMDDKSAEDGLRDSMRPAA